MRILFQGDSITAGDRGTAVSYAVYVQKRITAKFPDTEVTFFNRAIWGNQTTDLAARLEEDVFALHPDIVVLMIGVNDVLSHFDDKSLSADEFALRYESLLKRIKEGTNAEILLLEPYLIAGEPMRSHKRPLLIEFIERIREIAVKYASAYVPTDGLFASAAVREDISEFTVDGLHLSDKGARYIGNICAEYLSEIVKRA